MNEKTNKSKMKRMAPPTNQEAKQGQQQMAADRLLQTIERKDLKSYHGTANELLQEHDSMTVVAAALKILTKERREDRKSTRLNSSHVAISYAVFCLKKKN